MSRYKRSTIRYTLEPGSHVDAWHRFSRDHQDDASALAAINRYCADHGYILDRIWGRPATSGSVITSTHEFHEFIEAMEARPEAERRQRGIVVWKSSRLGRDQIETDYYTAHLRRLGYAVIAIADPLTGSDLDPVLEAFVRWKDQKLLEDISSDIKRTMQWLRDAGYATGGRPPRGFIAVHEENKLRPRRHSGEKRINARWVRGGQYEAATAEAWRLKVSGATDRFIHRATHLYKSEHCYHDMWLRHIYVEGGYVSEDDWQRVQTMMRERMVRPGDTERHPKRQESNYLLSGLLYCSCGAAMNGIAMPRKGSDVRSWTPGPDTYVYYRCGAVQRGQVCTDSSQGLLPAAAVDNAVVTAVLEEILTPAHLAALRSQIAERVRTARDTMTTRLATLREQHRRAEMAIERLTAAIEDGGAVGPLLEKLRERTEELEDVTRQIRLIEDEQAMYLPEIISDDEWNDLVAWITEGLRGAGSVQDRRSVLRTLIERVDILPGRAGLVIRYRISPMSTSRCPHWRDDHRHNHHFILTVPCPRARPRRPATTMVVASADKDGA